MRAPLTILYRLLNNLTQILFGMKLDHTVKVDRRVKLEHLGGMILGAREIGDDAIMRWNATMGIRGLEDLHAKPTLGPGVDVGAGALTGANSVVYTDCPRARSPWACPPGSSACARRSIGGAAESPAGPAAARAETYKLSPIVKQRRVDQG